MHTRLMREPHVLFVSYEFGPQVSGGVARVINGLSAALAGKVAFDVFLLQWRAEIDNFSGDLYRNGVDKRCYFTHYIETIRDLIRLNGYNIVHIMHAGEHTYEIVKFLREQAVDVVFSLHSIMKHDQSIRRASEKDLFHEDFLLKNSDHIHLLSETARQWIAAAYPEFQPNRDFHIIPNAIRCPAERKPVAPRGRARTVLCMSRWSHGKGLEYLLDAIPHVLAAVPDVRFILTGRKESSWEYDVASYVKKIDEKINDVADHVEVFGWIDDAQKDLLCARADLVVMPSEVEYFPYAILEPAAEGIPVVASRIAGSREILEEGRDCLMYDTTDVLQLAQNIVTVLGNPDLADKLATNAYARVSTEYTWDRVGNMYRDLYARVSNADRDAWRAIA
jgi:glycosyltransferase involved in cell wall biosynthesis